MTDSELQAYVRILADRLELRDWTIELQPEPPDPGNEATIVTTYGRKLAQLWLEGGGHAEELRRRIVHELCHCHFAAATDSVMHDLDGVLGGQADVILRRNFRRQMEFAIDAVSCALAPHLPLPA